jgi:hypothetical protein
MNRPHAIHLHIERLVMDAGLVSAGQSGALQAAVEYELSQLLAAGGGVPFVNSALAHLNTGSIQVSGENRPKQFGRQIARSIHGALQPANPPAHSVASARQQPSTRGPR